MPLGTQGGVVGLRYVGLSARKHVAQGNALGDVQQKHYEVANIVILGFEK